MSKFGDGLTAPLISVGNSEGKKPIKTKEHKCLANK